MERVLITGGTGGLGSQLTPLLKQAGYEVRVTSRSPMPAETTLDWAQVDFEHR